MNIVPIALAAETQTGIISAINRSIPGGIDNIFNLGLGIGAIIALGTVTYAGILYSTSGDNSSKQKEARAWIIAAAKGLALIAGGVIILNIINPHIFKVSEHATSPVPILKPPGYLDISGPGPSVHRGGGASKAFYSF